MKRVSVEIQGVWQCPQCDAEQASLMTRGVNRRDMWLLPSVLVCRECGEPCRAESVASVIGLKNGSMQGKSEGAKAVRGRKP